MEKKENKKCVFAGTFDPPTLGHKAVIQDCLKLFDEVVVAVLTNPAKTPLFSLEERKEMLALMFGGEQGLQIKAFDGTAVELLKQENADCYVRGVRGSVDLDYENANFYASRKLDPQFTTIYLPCPQELLHVSSGMVRSSLKFNTPIDEYVTAEVKAYIQNIQNQRKI